MKKILIATVIGLSVWAVFTAKSDKPVTPPDDPPLPRAPLPVIKPTESPEVIRPEETAPLPPGVWCLEDCPLIEPDRVEEVVRSYYRDIPILVEVARCESHFRQYDATGVVLKNNQGSSALGVMQIMASYHEQAAKELGWSIRDLKGNLIYARWLYEREGLRPWYASKHCWGKHLVAINNTISAR